MSNEKVCRLLFLLFILLAHIGKQLLGPTSVQNVVLFCGSRFCLFFFLPIAGITKSILGEARPN